MDTFGDTIQGHFGGGTLIRDTIEVHFRGPSWGTTIHKSFSSRYFSYTLYFLYSIK